MRPAISSTPRAAPVTTSREAEIVDLGIYDLSTDRTVPAPEAISGSRNIVSNIRLQHQIEEVDSELGRSFGFGFRFHLTDRRLFGEQLTLRTIFPPLTNSKTQRTATTQDRTVSEVYGELRYTAYCFDYDWEMVAGTWTFRPCTKAASLPTRALEST